MSLRDVLEIEGAAHLLLAEARALHPDRPDLREAFLAARAAKAERAVSAGLVRARPPEVAEPRERPAAL